jgi:hypothetical protein
MLLNYKSPGLRAIILLIIIAAVGIGLAAYFRIPVTFADSSYQIKEILYQAPIYSFAYTLDITPRFKITSDYILYSKHASDKDWIMHGDLKRFSISKHKLYSLFEQSFDEIHEVVSRAKVIYRADTNDDNETFYLVMQYRNGEILLAAGYEHEENPHIRWLFRLEKI